MRNFFTIVALLLLSTLASASALKGVRGSKRLYKEEPHHRGLKKEKKCLKFKEPKAEAHELKAAKKADDKAAKGEHKAGPEEKTATKENPDDDGARRRRRRHLQEKSPKEKLHKESECLEWAEDREGEGSSEAISDPSMGSTGGTTSSSSEFDSINVDCDAIANDKGPTDTHSVSFRVGIDVLKDQDATLNEIYNAMEQELQQKVAPRVAGCSSGRLLEQKGSSSGTTKIVHVDFGEMEFDHQGCDSSLAKEAKNADAVCMASDVPVDVYFVGDFPQNAIKKVEIAIEEHEWGVDGLLDTSEVDIVQTGSSLGNEGGSPGGMIGGIVAAVAACCCAACGYGAYKRKQDEGVVAKAELETDEESSDDEKQKKDAIPEVQATPVR